MCHFLVIGDCMCGESCCGYNIKDRWDDRCQFFEHMYLRLNFTRTSRIRIEILEQFVDPFGHVMFCIDG